MTVNFFFILNGGMDIEYKKMWLTSLSPLAKGMVRFGLGMARKIATSDWMVLEYTTGLYCLKSSEVKPLSWMILQNRGKNVHQKSRKQWHSAAKRVHTDKRVCDANPFIANIEMQKLHVLCITLINNSVGHCSSEPIVRGWNQSARLQCKYCRCKLMPPTTNARSCPSVGRAKSDAGEIRALLLCCRKQISTYFICLTIVLLPDSPAPVNKEKTRVNHLTNPITHANIDKMLNHSRGNRLKKKGGTWHLWNI